MRTFRKIPMPFVKDWRAANHTSCVHAIGTSLPMGFTAKGDAPVPSSAQKMESRFSSRYRLSPQTLADVLLKHL